MNEVPPIINRNSSVPTVRSRSVGPREVRASLYAQPVRKEGWETQMLHRVQKTLYHNRQDLRKVHISSVRELKGKDLMQLFDRSALEQRRKERETQEMLGTHDESNKNNARTEKVINASVVDDFLKPYTNEFMTTISKSYREQVAKLIDTLEVSKWDELMAKRCELFINVFNDCVGRRLMAADRSLGEPLKIVLREAHAIFTDSHDFLDQLNARMYRTITSTVETSKYDDILSECIQLVSLLQNPLMSFNSDGAEKRKRKLRAHIDYLHRNSFLPANKTKISTINNFEDDMKKLGKAYTDLHTKHEVAACEIEKYKQHIQELKHQITEQKDLYCEQADKLKEVMDQRILALEPKLDSVPLQYHTAEMKSLTKERDALSEELAAIQSQMQLQKQQLIKFVRFKKQLGLHKLDQESQTDMPSESQKHVVESRIDRILTGDEKLLALSTQQDDRWVLSIMNLLLQDKLTKDLADDLDVRPRISISSFMKQWFLTSFGSQKVAELFLGDFVSSLRDCCNNNLRFKSFCRLADFSCYVVEQDNGTGTVSKGSYEKSQKEILRRRFLASAFCSSLYLRTVYIIKSQINKCDFETFLPLIGSQDSYDITKLMQVLKEVLRLEHIPETVCEKVLEEFNSLVEKDLYLKLSENPSAQVNLGGGAAKRGKNTSSDLNVRFDTFLDFLLDKLADYYTGEVSKVFSKLRLLQSAAEPSNVSFETFQSAYNSLGMKMGQRWLEVRYSELMKKDVSHHPPLIQPFVGLLDCYYESRQVTYLQEKSGNKGPKALASNDVNDFRLKVCDVYNSVNVLLQTYHIIKKTVNLNVKMTGNLEFLLENFERDLKGVSSFLASITEPKSIPLTEKERLVKNLDVNWTRFRKILAACYSK